MAPAEAPTKVSNWIPSSSQALSTPRCAMPRAAPPEPTNAMRGVRVRRGAFPELGGGFWVGRTHGIARSTHRRGMCEAPGGPPDARALADVVVGVLGVRATIEVG